VFVGPTPPATQPRSLTQQVAEFQNYVDNGDVTFDPSTSLFFLLGGLKDHNLVTSAQVNAATASQVATLYSLGARVFEIALLPPQFQHSPIAPTISIPVTKRWFQSFKRNIRMPRSI
jgi:cholinesterase